MEVAVGGEEVVGVGVREEVERVLADTEERKEGGGGWKLAPVGNAVSGGG